MAANNYSMGKQIGEIVTRLDSIANKLDSLDKKLDAVDSCNRDLQLKVKEIDTTSKVVGAIFGSVSGVIVGLIGIFAKR